MISGEAAKEILRPNKVYSLRELNELLRLPPVALIEANRCGLITRSLGEGLQLHFLGIDLVEFLETLDVHGIPECIEPYVTNREARIGRRQRPDRVHRIHSPG